MRIRVYLYVAFAGMVGLLVVRGLVPASAEASADWVAEFFLTDFNIHSIDFSEINFDGARRDTISPVGVPQFVSVSTVDTPGNFQPVLSASIAGDSRAYPLSGGSSGALAMTDSLCYQP